MKTKRYIIVQDSESLTKQAKEINPKHLADYIKGMFEHPTKEFPWYYLEFGRNMSLIDIIGFIIFEFLRDSHDPDMLLLKRKDVLDRFYARAKVTNQDDTKAKQMADGSRVFPNLKFSTEVLNIFISVVSEVINEISKSPPAIFGDDPAATGKLIKVIPAAFGSYEFFDQGDGTIMIAINANGTYGLYKKILNTELQTYIEKLDINQRPVN